MSHYQPWCGSILIHALTVNPKSGTFRSSRCTHSCRPSPVRRAARRTDLVANESKVIGLLLTPVPVFWLAVRYFAGHYTAASKRHARVRRPPIGRCRHSGDLVGSGFQLLSGIAVFQLGSLRTSHAVVNSRTDQVPLLPSRPINVFPWLSIMSMRLLSAHPMPAQACIGLQAV
jgi:hypothetical protein